MTESERSQDLDKSGPPSSAEPPKAPFAWQPFTPRGLAAFAKATFGRLFLVLCTTALIAAGTTVWFLNTAWFPTIRAAVHELPEQGQIVDGKLNTPRATSDPLAEHRFLGFVVLVAQPSAGDLNSHIAIKFRETKYEICSIFGCLRYPYPAGWIIEFNRIELEPRWGAWEPIVLGAAAVVTFIGLMLVWLTLGFIYCLVPWVLAWIKKRDLPFGGSWSMCAAAFVPGALLFSATIWAYGLGVLDVLQFLLLALGHFVLGWVYIGFAFRVLPPRPPRVKNPFAPRVGGETAVEVTTAKKEQNSP